MCKSMAEKGAGLDGAVVESIRIKGDSIIVSARPRKRAPRCPVCGRRCDAYDRLPAPQVAGARRRGSQALRGVRADKGRVPRARHQVRGGAVGALGGEQVHPRLRGPGRMAHLRLQQERGLGAHAGRLALWEAYAPASPPTSTPARASPGSTA